MRGAAYHEACGLTPPGGRRSLGRAVGGRAKYWSLPMSRRKGEITPRRIDRDYPHQVEVFVPRQGLGPLLNLMHEFCHGLISRPAT